ncbi:MAG TPA: hypothetical protein VGK79_07475 [Gaiellaceae bacterium]
MSDAEILRRDGFGRLGYSLPADALVRLRAEAAELRAEAERVETDAYELHADGQDFRSPISLAMSEAGAELRGLHEGSALRTLANELAGTEMEPSKAGYLYYQVGDRIGLHTDLPACELVLLAAFDPVAPPLVVHPELRTLTPEQLAELAEETAGAPPGGISVTLDDAALVGLIGGGLPHQTRPVAPGSEAVVATLCYVGKQD